MILGNAEPATIGCIKAVDREALYLSKFINNVTFRRPMDLPATFTSPAPIGISIYTRAE